MSNKKLNFCTLFDSNYLSRGHVMLRSLFKMESRAFVYVFAFDEICESVLKSWNHPRLQVISLSEFEDDELLAVKPTRSPAEYCWTCTPSVIRFCLKKYNLDACTYIDADLFFFSSPKILFEEMGDKSVLITEHRYTPEFDQSKACGIYCVQFMCFKSDECGLKVLEWWRSACLDWCYEIIEEDRFGDQKYLDDWLDRFKGVHSLQHLGAGVAPWNIQQYEIFKNENVLFIKKDHDVFPVVFYHFQDFKRLSTGYMHFGRYARYIFTDIQKKLFYHVYSLALIESNQWIEKMVNGQYIKNYDIKDGWFKRFFNKKFRKSLRPLENISEKKYG